EVQPEVNQVERTAKLGPNRMCTNRGFAHRRFRCGARLTRDRVIGHRGRGSRRAWHTSRSAGRRTRRVLPPEGLPFRPSPRVRIARPRQRPGVLLERAVAHQSAAREVVAPRFVRSARVASGAVPARTPEPGRAWGRGAGATRPPAGTRVPGSTPHPDTRV